MLQLEGDENYDFRILRATKNRFGSTNEMGVFEMTEAGMRSVENPSELFLSERQTQSPGSVVVATVEGSRPLLVEVQALCAPSYLANPRRTVTGADFNRVNVVLAVIEKRLGLRLGDMDVFVNVVGGIRVLEPALDLGIALAVISSLKDVAVPPEACVFGEIGLAGEVRSVSHAERRANEAARLGFERCVMPRLSASKLNAHVGLKNVGAASLQDAVESLLPEALNRAGAGRKNVEQKNDVSPRDSRGNASRGGASLHGRRFANREVESQAASSTRSDEFADDNADWLGGESDV